MDELIWEYDLPHCGALCKHIREGRGGLRPTDIAKLYDLSESTVSRNLEQEGEASYKTFECYVKALQSNLARPQLTIAQAEVLLEFFDHSKARKDRTAEFAAVSFEDILPGRQRPEALTKLVGLLEQADQPAFIADSMWFIHARNGAILRLFGVDPHSPYLNRWEAWHAIATNFHANSPTRHAHCYAHEYFPPITAQFFNERRTRRLFFTLQMRMLLGKLDKLSRQHNFDFTDWWVQATRFNLSYKEDCPLRTVRYQGQGPEIRVRCRRHSQNNVAMGGKYPVPVCYTLFVWDPLDSAAREAFEDMRKLPECHKVYYAADYDKKHEFHINDWPEVKTKL